jgi:hypothetical protein
MFKTYIEQLVDLEIRFFTEPGYHPKEILEDLNKLREEIRAKHKAPFNSTSDLLQCQIDVLVGNRMKEITEALRKVMDCYKSSLGACHPDMQDAIKVLRQWLEGQEGKKPTPERERLDLHLTKRDVAKLLCNNHIQYTLKDHYININLDKEE